jgi:hypothetical protein
LPAGNAARREESGKRGEKRGEEKFEKKPARLK